MVLLHGFKYLMARYYAATWNGSLRSSSPAAPPCGRDRGDVRGVGKGYVWVFTIWRRSCTCTGRPERAHSCTDTLREFGGVLVSDFYAAYDSLSCPQQKCLVHLIRDLNQDIMGNPLDEELKALAAGFGRL